MTDHQLKNTDNPLVLDWLRDKNESMKRTKREDSQRRRFRTDILIDEQNTKDEKKLKALEEFQKWKRRKDKYAAFIL